MMLNIDPSDNYRAGIISTGEEKVEKIKERKIN